MTEWICTSFIPIRGAIFLNSHASGVILMFSPPISRSHTQNINSHASDIVPFNVTFSSPISRPKQIETVSSPMHVIKMEAGVRDWMVFILTRMQISQSYYIFL